MVSYIKIFRNTLAIGCRPGKRKSSRNPEIRNPGGEFIYVKNNTRHASALDNQLTNSFYSLQIGIT